MEAATLIHQREQSYPHHDGLNTPTSASPGRQYGDPAIAANTATTITTTTPPAAHPISQSTAALLAEPWPPETSTEFHSRFSASNPTYKNKLRLSTSHESRIRYFLTHPHAPPHPNNPTDARLKNRSRNFMLAPPSPTTRSSSSSSSTPKQALYRTDGANVRRHINEAEIWDFLTREHVRSGHKGRDRMLASMRNDYIGYTLEELMFVLQSCRVCRAAKTTAGAASASASTSTSTSASATAEGNEDEVRMQLRQRLGKAAAMARAGHWQVGQTAPRRYTVLEEGGGFGNEEEADDEDERAAWERAEKAFGMMGQDGGELRKSLYAPDEATGLVRYDVPDWYP